MTKQEFIDKLKLERVNEEYNNRQLFDNEKEFAVSNALIKFQDYVLKLAQQIEVGYVPKFKVGQTVWTNAGGEVVKRKIDFTETSTDYYLDNNGCWKEHELYPTQAEAERALKSEVGK